MDGTKRFSQLQRSTGSISQKVLTSNLRDLEANPGFHVGLERRVSKTKKTSLESSKLVPFYHSPVSEAVSLATSETVSDTTSV